MEALGLRLQESGFRNQASSLRNQASGLRLQASGFNVKRRQGVRCRLTMLRIRDYRPDLGFRVSGSRFRLWGSRFRI